jgi:hypothetical protein
LAVDVQGAQQYVSEAYDAIQSARDAGNTISVVWIPTNAEHELLKIAKDKAREATQQNATQQAQKPGMRSTTLRAARAKRPSAKSLPEKVGRHSKRGDTALPGKHTRLLYDRLSRKEAGILAQLRTGMAKINTYLHRIKAAASDQCACGQARETVVQQHGKNLVGGAFVRWRGPWAGGRRVFAAGCHGAGEAMAFGLWGLRLVGALERSTGSCWHRD